MNRAMVVEAQSQRDRSATQRPMLRWHAKAGLLVASIALLSFSFAPFDQWYLTWIGLVPMLIVIADCRSAWSAYCWTWIAATVFFAANMWWLIYVTGPGMAALVVLLGMYWAVPAMMLRASGVLYPRLAGWPDRRSDAREANTQAHPAKRPLPMTARMLLIPTAWVGLEWLRGTWPLHGLPWLYLGHTQSPALLICQIADLMGVAGVTFLVVLFNAFVALAILDGGIRRLRVAGGIVAACILATMIYGAIRFSQEAGDTTPGPRVLVVQANVPQSNSGSKGASQEDLIRFHVKETDDALARDPHQDLVVW